MWGDVCNSCGAHESSVRSVAKCTHCPTLICNGCKYGHEFGCAQAAQMKRYGLGPTVVRVVQTPIEVPTEDTPVIEANIPAPTQVTSQVQDEPNPDPGGVVDIYQRTQAENLAAESNTLTPEEIAAGTELLTQLSAAVTEAAPVIPAEVAQEMTDTLQAAEYATGDVPVTNTIFIPEYSPIVIPSTTENENSPSDPVEL